MTRRSALPPELIDRADGLRLLGHSWTWIGRVVGVHPARIRHAVTVARRRAGVGTK